MSQVKELPGRSGGGKKLQKKLRADEEREKRKRKEAGKSGRGTVMNEQPKGGTSRFEGDRLRIASRLETRCDEGAIENPAAGVGIAK